MQESTETIKVLIDAAPDACDGQLKVLLVDDDSFLHEMMQLFLAGTEYCLISASNVEEAMRLIAQGAPDIIVTDAMMPGESGFSFIEKLKSSPETARIPIILWTILEEVNGQVMDASHRADITVSKPFYLSNIKGSLERAKELIAYRKQVKL